MSKVIIRPYERDEVRGILDLWRAAGLVVPAQDPDRDIRSARTVGQGDVFVAEWESKLVGTIMVGREADQGWLYYLAVDPGVQRKGLGRALVRHAEKWFVAKRVKKATLTVRDTNRRVRGFYERLGYTEGKNGMMSRALDTPFVPPRKVPAGVAAEAQPET